MNRTESPGPVAVEDMMILTVLDRFEETHDSAFVAVGSEPS